MAGNDFVTVTAAFDSRARGPGELSLVRGANYIVIDRTDLNWWHVRCERTGEEGKAPTFFLGVPAAIRAAHFRNCKQEHSLARALFNYSGTDHADVIKLVTGQLYVVTDKDLTEWWLLCGGIDHGDDEKKMRMGIGPANYLEELPPSDIAKELKENEEWCGALSSATRESCSGRSARALFKFVGGSDFLSVEPGDEIVVEDSSGVFWIGLMEGVGDDVKTGMISPALLALLPSTMIKSAAKT